MAKSLKVFSYFCNKQSALKNKVVIITGASSGIGKALAIQCAEKKAKVVLAARNFDKLKSVNKEITAKGGEALIIVTDVTNSDECKNLINITLSHFKKIDILINNAGISMRALFKNVELDVIKKLMDVNFWGTVYCTKYSLPHILSTKGSIVGVISIAGYIGLPARTGYAASKFAVRGFLDTLRIEHLKEDLHVLVAAPGFTTSNIRTTALNESGKMQGESPRDESKMMSSEDCAKYIIRAIEKRKNQLILTFWEGKVTVWLKKWYPALLERLTYKHMAKEDKSPLN